jgi:hypothetical protein
MMDMIQMTILMIGWLLWIRAAILKQMLKMVNSNCLRRKREVFMVTYTGLMAVLAPQALHLSKYLRSSFTISVSGREQTGQVT